MARGDGGGRPTKFNEDVAKEICRRMVEGESLRAICRDDHLPCAGTVLYWVAQGDSRGCDKPDLVRFSDQYEAAMIARSDALVEEIIEISDDATNDWMEKHGKDAEGYQINGEAMARSRLRVDTRKWVASKMKPKRYGDKQQIEHSGSIDLNNATDEELAARLAELDKTNVAD